MTGRSNKVIGQIGEFLACAEIARRCDCITTPFAGNVPDFDLLIADADCRAIPVQVKTANGGAWQFDASRFLELELDEHRQLQTIRGLRELKHPRLVYVFVWLGHTREEVDQFFLCTASDLQQAVFDNYNAWLEKHGGHRPRNWKTTHCAIRTPDLRAFRNNWALVSERLAEDLPAV